VQVLKVAHVTHTDISSDSRILKSMDAVRQLEGVKVYGLGLSEERGAKPVGQNYFLRVRSLLKRLPRLLRLMLLSPLFIFLEFFLVFLFKLVKIRPSIVHAHDYLALVPCYFYSVLFGSKLIYDAHELESRKNGIGRAASYLVATFERLVWSRIDGFITVSNAIEEWYQQQFGAKESAVVLNSPIVKDTDEGGVNTSFRDIFSIPDERIVAVYVGLFVKGRGIENILELAKTAKNIHFVFLGDGELKQSILSVSKDFDNVDVHPFVEHFRVVSYLKEADIGLCLLENVSLSDYYAIPNKLLEYSFSGLYVLATDFPEMRGLIDKYKLGKCLPDDLESAKVSLEEITQEQVAERRTQSTESLYDLSWEAQEKKILKLYRQVLESNH